MFSIGQGPCFMFGVLSNGKARLPKMLICCGHQVGIWCRGHQKMWFIFIFFFERLSGLSLEHLCNSGRKLIFYKPPHPLIVVKDTGRVKDTLQTRSLTPKKDLLVFSKPGVNDWGSLWSCGGFPAARFCLLVFSVNLCTLFSRSTGWQREKFLPPFFISPAGRRLWEDPTCCFRSRSSRPIEQPPWRRAPAPTATRPPPHCPTSPCIPARRSSTRIAALGCCQPLWPFCNMLLFFVHFLSIPEFLPSSKPAVIYFSGAHLLGGGVDELHPLGGGGAKHHRVVVPGGLTPPRAPPPVPAKSSPRPELGEHQNRGVVLCY